MKKGKEVKSAFSGENNRKDRIKNYVTDVAFDVIGGLMIAFGTYNFTVYAEFPMVGLSGIALIFYHLMNIPIGITTAVLNIPIALICYKSLGKSFFLRSVKSIIITSLIMDVIGPAFPVFSGDKLLAAICAGVLSGIGYGLIYMRNSSTGGVDFVVMTIKKAHPHLTIGSISFVIDVFIIILGTAVVSGEIENLIYGMIISFILSAVVD